MLYFLGPTSNCVNRSSYLYEFGTAPQEVVILEPAPWKPPDLFLGDSVIYVQVQPTQADSTEGGCVAAGIETAFELKESCADSSKNSAEHSFTTEHHPSGEHEESLSAPVLLVSDDETSGGHSEHSYVKRPAEHSYSEWPGTKPKAKEHSCSACSFVTTHASRLARHVLLHTGEKPHKCPVCGKSFRLRATMVLHLRTHTGERPYTCKTCGRTFAHGSSLAKHKVTHSAERTEQCEVCDVRVRPFCLRRHMRTHTGEKPFTCNVCAAVFADKNALKRHMLRKHPANE